jgi:hypothetical protein
LRQHSRRRRHQRLGNVLSGITRRKTAKAHILNKDPGRMSASCCAALGRAYRRVFLGPGGSVSGFLVDPGGDLVTGWLPESLAGILAALPGQKATS